ncbi:hypothetical protein PYCC9005_000288 [Savitreella phatthalungensis]
METDRLLQHSDSPTAVVARKLRTYLQVKALGQGYLPSTSQVEAHLAAVIQTSVLNPRQRGLSAQSRKAVEDARNFIRALRLFVRDKNDGDLIQEIVWSIRGASVESEFDLDSDAFLSRLDLAQARADAQLAHAKTKAIADMLYSNPQFRALLHDGSILARDILSDLIEKTAQAVAPAEHDLIQLEEQPRDVDGRAIKDDIEDTRREVRETAASIKNKAQQVYDAATESAIANLRELQRRGQVFGEHAQQQVQHLGAQAKEVVSRSQEHGSEALSEISKKAADLATSSIGKLEELTGISRADIERALNQGVSVDDLIARGKDTIAGVSHKVETATASLLDDASQGTQTSSADQTGEDISDDVKQASSTVARKANQVVGATKAAASNKMMKNKAESSNDNDSHAGGVAASAQTKGQSSGKASDAFSGDQQKNTEAIGEAHSNTQKRDHEGTDLKSSTDGHSSAKRDDGATASGVSPKKGSIPQDRLRGSGNERSEDPDFSDDILGKDQHLRQIGIRHDASGETTAEPDDQDTIRSLVEWIRQALPSSSDVDEPTLEQAARKLIRTSGGSTTTSHGKSRQSMETQDSAKADDKNKQQLDGAASSAGTAQNQAPEVVEKSMEAAKDAVEIGSEAGTQASKVLQRADQDAGSTLEAAKQQSSEALSGVKSQAEKAKKQAGNVAKQVSETGSEVAEAASRKFVDADHQAGKQMEEIRSVGSSAANRVAQESSSIKEKTEGIARDVERRIGNIKQADIDRIVRDLLKTARQKATDISGVTQEDLRDYANQAYEQGVQAYDSIRNGISERATQAEDVAVEIGAQGKRLLANAPRDAPGQIHETLDATEEITEKAVEALKASTSEIRDYLSQKFPPKRREALRRHFRLLAASMRDHTDYSNVLDGVVSISRKYVNYVMTFAAEASPDLNQGRNQNAELDRAVTLTIELIERFSNGRGFGRLQKAYGQLRQDFGRNQDLTALATDGMTLIKRIVQDWKYAASSDMEDHARQLLERIDSTALETGIKGHLEAFIREVFALGNAFASDRAVLGVVKTARHLSKSLLYDHKGHIVLKRRILRDFFHILMPSAIRLVQYIPISRIEFQSAEIDLVIENLVFESSASHDQTFLPYKLRIENQNVVEWLNAYKLERDYSQAVTAKIEGLTLAVRDAGFYIKKKTGFWRFVDDGLVDILMDGPGIDIDVDLAMSTEDEEADVTRDALFVVKDVRVKIHRFDFTTSGASHGWLVGLFKPFVRGFVRRQIEIAMAQGMREQLEYYEYQLRMLKHRVKTAMIANNGQASVSSFFKAVFTANAGYNRGKEGQFEIAIGRKGPLRGVYTRASIQRQIEDDDDLIVAHGRTESWRNDVFDVAV